MSSPSIPNQQPTLAANLLSIPKSALPSAAVAKWELGVSLILHNWRVLTDAVAGQWGGPDSGDKRDWLCGAIADIFTEREETDEYDLEDTLVHAMEDEFTVNLEDDSAWEVARRVVSLRKEILEGNYATVDELHTRFLTKPLNQNPKPPPVREVIEKVGSSDNGDEEMSEAPSPLPAEPRQQSKPVIDEEGFELVQKRGNRNR